MNSVKGSTASETKLIKAVQSAVGAKVDGLIGAQTISDIAVKVGASCWPLTLQIYSNPVIICEDIDVIGTTTRCSAHKTASAGPSPINPSPAPFWSTTGKPSPVPRATHG